MFKLSQKSKDRREGVDPRLIEISDQAIIITLVDFGIPQDGGMRNASRQNELFLDNKSKADGYKNASQHQLGKALDFYAYVDGKASWEHHHLAMVAVAFLQSASMLGYELNCGILWKSIEPKLINSVEYGWDAGHLQLVD